MTNNILNIKSEELPIVSSRNLVELNRKYKKLTPEQRIQEVYSDFEKILLTSSFGTTAVYQLHLFYKQEIKQPVHFINTSYHFKETLDYKIKLSEMFNLDVVDIIPDKDWNELSRKAQLWKSDPDQCCSINKVDPFEKVKLNFNLWTSGLMRWQSNHRETLEVFEQRNGIIKFYPILDVTESEVRDYINKYDLPEHPLIPLGYESIGCIHCTKKGEKRKGRWTTTIKTECGLHL